MPLYRVRLSALAVLLAAAGCSLEVNIHTDGHEEHDADEAQTVVVERLVPPPPQVSHQPEARIPRPPPPVRPDESRVDADRRVIRDALFRQGLQPMPPQPRERAEELAEAPTFTPFTVAPSIVNRSEVVAAMQGAYPEHLREAGIGGTVRVYFFIDADGVVQQIRLDNSSGNEALDDAAMLVADVYRFTPALNREERVPVWVSFPITFQVR